MKNIVITFQPTASIADALQMIQKEPISHVPIIDENKAVIGIVLDRDMRDVNYDM